MLRLTAVNCPKAVPTAPQETVPLLPLRVSVPPVIPVLTTAPATVTALLPTEASTVTVVVFTSYRKLPVLKESAPEVVLENVTAATEIGNTPVAVYDWRPVVL